MKTPLFARVDEPTEIRRVDEIEMLQTQIKPVVALSSSLALSLMIALSPAHGRTVLRHQCVRGQGVNIAMR